MNAPYRELMLGLPIILDPTLEDDRAYFVGNSVLIGTKPPDELGLLRREARLYVRRGLADVLEWLGRPVVNEPILDLLRGERLTVGYRKTIVEA